MVYGLMRRVQAADPVYVRAGLDDERMFVNDCGCIWSWRRTPRMERVTFLFGCDTLNEYNRSILDATYGVETLIRWQ